MRITYRSLTQYIDDKVYSAGIIGGQVGISLETIRALRDEYAQHHRFDTTHALTSAGIITTLFLFKYFKRRSRGLSLQEREKINHILNKPPTEGIEVFVEYP